MSTNAIAGFLKKNGAVEAATINWDGYLEHTGKLLNQYVNLSNIQTIVDLHPISHLEVSFDMFLAESYDEYEEPNPMIFESLGNFIDNIQYRVPYVFDEKSQTWFTLNDKKELVKLETALEGLSDGTYTD
jgi:hypothetical protein